MANNLAKLIIGVGNVVGKAFARAVRREILESQQAAKARSSGSGRDVNKGAAADSLTGMSLQEAKQILNVDHLEEIETVQKNFEHLFQANDKTKGGSFYIQSKVVRAKERIDQELQMQEELKRKEQSKAEQKEL